MAMRAGRLLRALRVGEEASCTLLITAERIAAFSGVSGDDNPIHLSADAAVAAGFPRGPVAHGMLVSSLFSRLMGTELPGPGSIYVRQKLEFVAPVFAGDTVTARVRIAKIDPARRGGVMVVLETTAQVDGRDVVRGEALGLLRDGTNAAL